MSLEKRSMVFTQGGREIEIEIWDICRNTMDPTFYYFLPPPPFLFLFYSESSGSCLKAVNIKWSSTFIILLFASSPISSTMNIVVHQQVKCWDKIYFLLSDCVNVSCCWWQLTSGLSWYIVCCCNDAPGIVLVLCCQSDDTDGTTWRRRSWQRWRFSSCCLRCS